MSFKVVTTEALFGGWPGGCRAGHNNRTSAVTMLGATHTGESLATLQMIWVAVLGDGATWSIGRLIRLLDEATDPAGRDADWPGGSAAARGLKLR